MEAWFSGCLFGINILDSTGYGDSERTLGTEYGCLVAIRECNYSAFIIQAPRLSECFRLTHVTELTCVGGGWGL